MARDDETVELQRAEVAAAVAEAEAKQRRDELAAKWEAVEIQPHQLALVAERLGY